MASSGWLTVKSGKHKLELKRQGYQSYRTSFEVQGDEQKVIPEKTPEKVALAKQYKAKRVAHETGAPEAELPGLSKWNERWVGPEGYQGMVAKQMQQFKRTQEALKREAEEIAETAETAGDPLRVPK